MASSVLELLLKVTGAERASGALRDVGKASKDMGQGVGDASREMSGMEKAVTVLRGVLGALAVKEIAQTVFELGKLGASAERTESAFTNISGGAGNAAANMRAMQDATRGTMSDMELMGAASKLMQMGLATNADELGRVAGMAVKLGTAMGMEAGPAIENFSLMLANQSLPRLDSYGISSGKVRTRILELMDATEGMTREQAFMIATMEEGEAAMERLGDVTDDAAVAIEQAEAKFENAKVTIAKRFTPAVAEAATVVADLLDALAGELPRIFKEASGQVDASTLSVDDWVEAVAAAGYESQTYVGHMQHLTATERLSEDQLRDLIEQYYRQIGAVDLFTNESGPAFVDALEAEWQEMEKAKGPADNLSGAIGALSAEADPLVQRLEAAALAEKRIAENAAEAADALRDDLSDAFREAGLEGEKLAAAQLALKIISGELTAEEYAQQLRLEELAAAYAAGEITLRQLWDAAEEMRDGQLGYRDELGLSTQAMETFEGRGRTVKDTLDGMTTASDTFATRSEATAGRLEGAGSRMVTTLGDVRGAQDRILPEVAIEISETGASATKEWLDRVRQGAESIPTSITIQVTSQYTGDPNLQFMSPKLKLTYGLEELADTAEKRFPIDVNLGLGPVGMATAAAANAAQAGGSSTNITNNLTVNTGESPGSVLSQWVIYQAMAGAA